METLHNTNGVVTKKWPIRWRGTCTHVPPLPKPLLVVRKFCFFFMNSFSLRKNRSHLEPGQRIWS